MHPATIQLTLGCITKMEVEASPLQHPSVDVVVVLGGLEVVEGGEPLLVPRADPASDGVIMVAGDVETGQAGGDEAGVARIGLAVVRARQ